MNKKTNITFDVLYIPAEEGGYTAIVPALPGCISEGDSIEEAQSNIIEAIELYLEDISESRELEEMSESKPSLLQQVSIPVSKLSLN